MKVQIRRSIFETNSSSMHAITVVKDKTKVYAGFSCDFRCGEFGWEHRTYYDRWGKISYLWTAIVHHFIKSVEDEGTYKAYDGKEYPNYHYELDVNNPEYIKIKEAIIKALVNAGFENDGYSITFQESCPPEDKYLDAFGYIDHTPGMDFIQALVFNEDRLIRFLFNDKSKITTWNDNEWSYDGEDEYENNAPDSSDTEAWEKYWRDEEWKYFDIDPNDPNIEWKYLKSN